MPFGFSGAPGTFQRLMDRVINGLSLTKAYLDDLVIYSSTWQEHLSHVEQICLRLKKAGLTVQLKKCQLAMEECTYLGHVIGKGTTRPELSKLKAVEIYPVPTTKKDVPSFLGLTGDYRRCIPNYATIAKPLTDLTWKSVPERIPWSMICQEAFQILKQTLLTNPIVRNPDFSKEFILQTDASEVGIGAVLSQLDDNDQDHPIGYFSRKLLPRDQKYATVEKECLAVKLGIQHFAVYLMGKPFRIQTDYRALQWLDNFKEKNSRLTRWSLALQPFTFTIEHKKGKDNANADTLSRMPEYMFQPLERGGKM